MTIIVAVTNTNQGGSHNVRVHRCTRAEEGLHVEDGVIIPPGESREFTIYDQVRLAVEEEQ